MAQTKARAKQVTYKSDATGGAVRNLHDKLSETVSVKDFGAVGDGVTDDTAAIQAAIDSLGTSSVQYSSGGTVVIPKGRYVISDELQIKSSWVTIKGSGEFATVLDFTGTSGKAAINTASVDNVYSYISVRDLAINVNSANTRGITFDRCQSSSFKNLAFNLRTDNTVAVYGAGNGVGSAPYYNHFDNILIAGQWTPGTPTTDCVGFRFVLNNSSLLDAPNGNLISNVKRAASLNIAFDIQAGNGNMFTNIGAESIGENVFRFGAVSATASGTATSGAANSITDTGASFPTLSSGTLVVTGGTGSGTVATIDSSTSTSVTLFQAQPLVFDNTTQYEVYAAKCSSNKVVNLRHEGTNTDHIVKFGYGSFANNVGNVFSTGATKLYNNAAMDTSSVFSSNGNYLVPLTFYATDLAASTTTRLSPTGGTGLSISGGVRLPSTGVIAAVTTSVDNFSSGGLGEATVNTVFNGTTSTSLSHVINANNRFGYSKAEVEGTSVKIRDRQVYVTVTTDGSWNQTSADFCVTLWVAI